MLQDISSELMIVSMYLDISDYFGLRASFKNNFALVQQCAWQTFQNNSKKYSVDTSTYTKLLNESINQD
ncbi:hypothetical protein HDV01_004797, partial [Terramyces sp. JEL0728]